MATTCFQRVTFASRSGRRRSRCSFSIFVMALIFLSISLIHGVIAGPAGALPPTFENSSLEHAISEAIDNNENGFRKALTALSPAEKDEVIVRMVRIGDADFVGIALEAGCSPYAFDGDGKILAQLTESDQIQRLLKNSATRFPLEDEGEHFIKRILAGLGTSNDAVKLEIEGLDVSEEFIKSLRRDEFFDPQIVSVSFERISPDVIGFRFGLNLGFLSGTSGGGRFVERGEFWHLNWDRADNH